MGLETIWTDYSAGLRRYLSMRLSDPDDVEDVPQTVLIKTHATLPDLGEVRNLRAWLTRVARNAAVDFHRRKGRADPHPDDLWYHDDGAPEDPGLDRCVRPFLAALPAEQGALLTAIDLNGQSQKAFAAQHGLAYSTVKSRVQAARSALRALLKLISFTICPFVQRVAALLEAKQIPYQVDYISLADKPDWFLDISPNGQVPVLVIELGAALFESDAIMEYLEEAHRPLIPDMSPVAEGFDQAFADFYLSDQTYLGRGCDAEDGCADQACGAGSCC